MDRAFLYKEVLLSHSLWTAARFSQSVPPSLMSWFYTDPLQGLLGIVISEFSVLSDVNALRLVVYDSGLYSLVYGLVLYYLVGY